MAINWLSPLKPGKQMSFSWPCNLAERAGFEPALGY
jgi:hypothetical protein